MKTTDKLHDALASIEGKTPDEIAKIMLRRGIKGRLGTTGNCPLAVFFNGMQPGRFVIGKEYIMRVVGSGKTATVEKAKTPENLVKFIRNMDAGDYPQLMAPPPRCMPKRVRAKDTRKWTEARRKTKRTPTVRINHFARDVGRYHEATKS